MIAATMSCHHEIQSLLQETIVLVCRNVLKFKDEFSVEALVGVTVDRSEVILVSVKENFPAERTAAYPESDSKLLSDSHQLAEVETCGQADAFISQDEVGKIQQPVACRNSDRPTSAPEISTIRVSRTAQSPKKRMRKKSRSDVKHVIDDDAGIAAANASDSNEWDVVVSRQFQSRDKVPRDEFPVIQVLQQLNQGVSSEPNCNFGSIDFQKAAIDLSQFSESKEQADSAAEARSNRSKSDHRPLELNCDWRSDHSSCDLHCDRFSSDCVVVKPAAADDCNFRNDVVVEPINADQYQSAAGSIRRTSQIQDGVSTFAPTTDQEGTICMMDDDSFETIGSLLPTRQTDDVIDDLHFLFIRRSILSYHGWCVPLRDLQRLRLRSGTSAVVIRQAMKSLERDGLGYYRMLHGGMNVFYKCPPEIVDATTLALVEMSADEYKLHYESAPMQNATNRHSDNYWQKIANGSPYIE